MKPQRAAISSRVRSPPGLHLCSDNSPGPSQPLSATPPPCETAQRPGLAKQNKTKPSACGKPRDCASSPPARKSLSLLARHSRRDAQRNPAACGGGEGKDAPGAEPRGCTGLNFPFLISPTSFSLSPRTSPCGQRAGSPRAARPGRTRLAPRTRKQPGSRRYAPGRVQRWKTKLAKQRLAPRAARLPPAPPRASRTPAGPCAHRCALRGTEQPPKQLLRCELECPTSAFPFPLLLRAIFNLERTAGAVFTTSLRPHGSPGFNAGGTSARW